MRILLVEDDPDLSRQLKLALADAGYAVDHAPDGEEAQFLGETEPYDAVILDLGLPKVDGVSVLERWRRENMATPVLILTARGAWSEKVAGFDAGADDYLTKPFHTEELLARLRALLRRSAGHAAPSLACGGLRLDPRAARASVNGEPLRLTSLEYRLLHYLMMHQGRVISRTELVEHLYDQDFDRDSNTIEVFIGRRAQEDRRRPHRDRPRAGLPADLPRRGDRRRGAGLVRSRWRRLIPAGLRQPSLARRLVLLALGWSLATLIVSAIGLALLFQQAAIRRIDQTLGELIDNLLAGSTVEQGAGLRPAVHRRALPAGLFRPLLGNRRADRRQQAALARPLPLAVRRRAGRTARPDRALQGAGPGRPVHYDTRGPQNEPLRARAQQAWLPGRKAPVIFLAAEDRTSINRDVRGFVAATAVDLRPAGRRPDRRHRDPGAGRPAAAVRPAARGGRRAPRQGPAARRRLSQRTHARWPRS